MKKAPQAKPPEAKPEPIGKKSKRIGSDVEKMLQRKGLSLHGLWVLSQVDEAGSIIKAARGDEVRASQFVRQVGDLQKCFEFELTQRDGRTVKTNAEGATLARMAREFLRGMEDFMQRGQGRVRTYRIGAGESLLQWIVIPGLSTLSHDFPRARFRLSNLQNSQIALGLEDMTLDYGLLRRESLRWPLVAEPLGGVNYVLCVPRSLMHGIAPGDWRGALETLPLAVHLETAYVQGELDAALDGLGLKPNVRLRCDSFPSAMAALRTEAFATLMIQFPGKHCVPEDVVAMDLPCLEHAAREVVLAWNPRLLKLRPEAEHIRNALRKQLAWKDRQGGSTAR